MADEALWQEFSEFTTRVIWYACKSSRQAVREAARYRLTDEYYSGTKEFQVDLMTEIDKEIHHYRRMDQIDCGEKLGSLKEDMEIQL